MKQLSRAEITVIAPCEKCGAKRGQQCTKRGKPREQVHHQRMHLAQLWRRACEVAGEHVLDKGVKPP